MIGTFYSLIWNKADVPYLKQGVKGNRRPKRAMYGSNGSYMVAGENPQLHLFVKGEDGEIYRFNIYGRVLKETGRKHMSQKLYEKVKQNFETAIFVIENNIVSWDCSF